MFDGEQEGNGWDFKFQDDLRLTGKEEVEYGAYPDLSTYKRV